MKYFVRVDGEEHEVTVDETGVHYDGVDVPARVCPVSGTPVHVMSLGTETHRIVVRRGARRGDYTLSVDGHRFTVEAIDERTKVIRELSGAAAAHAGPTHLTAPMPGLVVRIHVNEGDTVQAGQGLVVMEAMKMENELRAAGRGVVKKILAAPGTAVEKGALLIEMEQAD